MVKVGIVGCGVISTQKYIPILQKMGSTARLVGLCDLNEEALRRVAAEFRIEYVYTEMSDMISAQSPEMVVVCTPPRTHAAVAVKAMEMGSHVLVEKPMGVSTDDCDRMLEAAERHGKKLGVMHNQVFNPAVEKALALIADGAIGRFLGMRVFLATAVDYMTSQPDHWAHRLPGGVVGETGPHAVYTSLAFLESVRDVQVRAKKLLPECSWSASEDIRFDLIADNGVSSVALVYGGVNTAADVDIIGTEGLLKLDLQGRLLVHHHRPGTSAKVVAISVFGSALQMLRSLGVNGARHVFSRNLDPHYRGITRFMSYLAGGVDYPATGEDGRKTVALMERLVRKMDEAGAV